LWTIHLAVWISRLERTSSRSIVEAVE
jgi:hypothetical protein